MSFVLWFTVKHFQLILRHIIKIFNKNQKKQEKISDCQTTEHLVKNVSAISQEFVKSGFVFRNKGDINPVLIFFSITLFFEKTIYLLIEKPESFVRGRSLNLCRTKPEKTLAPAEIGWKRRFCPLFAPKKRYNLKYRNFQIKAV